MTEPSSPAEVETFTAEHPAHLRAIELRLRDLLVERTPNVREYVDRGNKLLAYAVGPKMADFLFAIIVHKAHVNLQLADGVDLPDPAGIVEGTGKRIRHVKLRSLEDVDRRDVRDLIDAQVALKQR